MSDTNTAPGEQPAPEIAPVQTGGEQPQVTDHATALEALDQTALGEILFGEKKEPAESPAPSIASQTEAAPAAVTPTEPPAASEQPPVDPVPEPAIETPATGPKRLSVRSLPANEQTQLATALEMVRNGEASGVFEALQKIAGPVKPPAPAAEVPEVEPIQSPAPAAPAQPTTVAGIEATIADLRAQRDQADDDFNKTEVRRLTTLIEDTVGLLAQTRVSEVSRQQSANSYQQEYVTAVDELEAKYAWATDENSPLFHLLDDKVTAARARNDSALSDPRFILTFAESLAGIATPVVPKPQEPAKIPEPPKPAKVVGAALAPGHSEAHQPTRDEARSIIENATQEQLGAVLFGS